MPPEAAAAAPATAPAAAPASTTAAPAAAAAPASPAPAAAPAAAAPAAAPAAPAAAPAAIVLELPKDSKLVQADVDRIAAIAREQGLSQEQATKLLTEQNATVAAYEARQTEAAKTQRAAWAKAVTEDKEIGGDKLSVTQRNSMRVVEKFMPQPLRDKLRETGLGDYPDFVRFLNNVGAAMAEDSGVVNSGGPAHGQVDAASKLYDNPTSK